MWLLICWGDMLGKTFGSSQSERRAQAMGAVLVNVVCRCSGDQWAVCMGGECYR